MPFPSFYVSLMRVPKPREKPTTATSMSVRATLEVTFLRSVFKTGIRNISYYPFEQLEGDRMAFPSKFVSPRVFLHQFF